MKLALTKTIWVTLVAVACMGAVNIRAQSPPAANPQANPESAGSNPVLTKELTDLQRKAAKLQATLAQNTSPAPGMPPMGQASAAPAPAGMPPGGMGMDKMEKDKMAGMQSKAPPAGNDMGGMMGMMGMMKDMKMGGMPAGSSAMAGMPKSALPGFPGVSHLYHIGATGLFLDHAEHINLSSDQQVALNKIKQEALAAKSSSERQIEQAEQELGDLTSSDRPDAAVIEKKVHDIERLRADERLAFIRTVGEAAKLLTDDQRKILTGATQPTAPALSPSATMAPMSDM